MTKTTNRLPTLDLDLLQHIEDYLVHRAKEAAHLDYLGEVAPDLEEIEDLLPSNLVPVRVSKRVLDGEPSPFDSIDELNHQMHLDFSDVISGVSPAFVFEEWETDYGTFLMNPAIVH